MIFKQAQIDGYLKNPSSDVKAVLLYGQNEGLIAEYAKKFVLTVSKDLYDPFSVVYLDWDNIKSDVGVLFSEYNSQSLMGSRRVIVLKNADNSLTKHAEDLIKDSKSDSLLIITGGSSLNGKSSLVVFFNNDKSVGAIPCYEDRDENVVSSTRAFLIEKGVTFSNDAFVLLCARLSNDRKANVNEIEKLITYVGSKKHFDVDDVRAVVFDQAVSGIDDLCFYTFSGVKLKAMNSLKYLLNEGVEEVQIIRAFTRHVNKLLDGKALMENGETSSSAIKKILPKNMFYRYDMGASQLSAWSRDRLFDAIELLYKGEKDCKTTNMPTTDVVNYMVLTLLSAASKLVK